MRLLLIVLALACASFSVSARADDRAAPSAPAGPAAPPSAAPAVPWPEPVRPPAPAPAAPAVPAVAPPPATSPAQPEAVPVAPAPAIPAAAPSAAPPAPAPSATPSSAPSEQLPPPRRGVTDSEQPPPINVRPPPPSGPFVRLALGAQVALLTDGDKSELRLPSYLHLDLGYAFSPDLALLARFGSWLSFDPWALDFIGAGASFGFVAPETMFVTALIGVSLLDDAFAPSGDEAVQGLAVQVELGQRWTLLSHLYFELGAHFELGTPWLANDADFVSFGVGPFVSLRWGG